MKKLGIARSVFYLILATIGYGFADGALSFVESERNILAEKGSSQTLTWTYQGTTTASLTGITWLTYIPSAPKTQTNLKTVWAVDDSGNHDTSIPEQPSYQGQLSATKVGNTLSLVISNVDLNDTNSYFCQLILFGATDVSSNAINMIVGVATSMVKLKGIFNNGTEFLIENGKTYNIKREDVKLNFTADGNPPPTMTCTFSSGTKFEFEHKTLEDGDYTCKVSNPIGNPVTVKFAIEGANKAKLTSEPEPEPLSDGIIAAIAVAAVAGVAIIVVIIVVVCMRMKNRNQSADTTEEPKRDQFYNL